MPWFPWGGPLPPGWGPARARPALGALPGLEQEQLDQPLHHTALRKLREETGLEHEDFKHAHRVRAGPQPLALKQTTHFAYALNSPIPQAELARSFAGRGDSCTILDIQWPSQDSAARVLWRTEDTQMLQRLWQHAVYLS